MLYNYIDLNETSGYLPDVFCIYYLMSRYKIKSKTRQDWALKSKEKKEHVVDSLNLPKDMMLGASIVTITGNKEAWVENYKGIIAYHEKQIILQGKTCQICFVGQGMSIDYYTNEDMKISGQIECVRYC